MKLPLWLKIVYFVFIVLAPAAIIALSLDFIAGAKMKGGIIVVGSALLLVVVLKTFIFNGLIEKNSQKIVLLEHDYSVGVGDKVKIQELWHKYNLFEQVVKALTIVLVSLLCSLIILAILSAFDSLEKSLNSLKLNIFLTMGSVLIGVFIRCAWHIVKGSQVDNVKEVVNAGTIIDKAVK